MAQTFTLKTLIRFFYKETTSEQDTQVQEALESNYLLHEDYSSLCETLSSLNIAPFSPSAESINRILGYSQNSNALTEA